MNKDKIKAIIYKEISHKTAYNLECYFNEHFEALIDLISENNYAFFVEPREYDISIKVANKPFAEIPIPLVAENPFIQNMDYLFPFMYGDPKTAYSMFSFTMKNAYSLSMNLEISTGFNVYKRIEDKNKIKFIPDVNPNSNRTITINQNNEWYIKPKNKRPFNATLKTILKKEYLPAESKDLLKPYITELFKQFTLKNKALNSILAELKNKKEEYDIPISIKYLIENYKNNIQIIKELYKKPYTHPLFNKITLKTAIALSKVLNKIPLNYQSDAILAVKNRGLENNLSKPKEILKNVLECFFLERIKPSSSENSPMINFAIIDYIDMSLRLKRPINFSIKSEKRMILEHNRLANEIEDKKLAEIKLSKNSPFKRLQMPNNIIPLLDRDSLIDESNFNHNCVKSYIPKINEGKCAIYSYRPTPNERYTTEIAYNKNKNIFELAQIAGFANSKPQNDIIAYVQKAIDENNSTKTSLINQ